MNVKDYVAHTKELLKKVVAMKKDVNLCIIQVGDNPASNSYIKGKLADCKEIGVNADLVRLGEDVTTEYLVNFIEELNNSKTCNGIIVQLPLPKHIDVKKVQLAIAPHKDVDGFHPMSEFIPCTPLGVVHFLVSTGYNFEGKTALVIGRSDIVGKPLLQLLINLNSTVTLAHSKTSVDDLKHYMKNSDIVFTAIDKIEYFDEEYFQFLKGVPVIIDIGLGKSEQGKLRGNLSLELVNRLEQHGNSVISGTGGVGLLTRLELLSNTVRAQSEYKEN